MSSIPRESPAPCACAPACGQYVKDNDLDINFQANEIIGFRDEDFDELFGGREAFADYLVCIDREACLALFDAYLNMERTNY